MTKRNPAVEAVFDKMTPEEVRALYEQSRAQGIGNEVGGLDQHAAEYLQDRATGDPNVDIPKFTDDFARRANLERFVRLGKGNHWGPDMTDLLASAYGDDVAAILHDPAVQHALGHRKLTDAAAAIAEDRTAASTGAVAEGAGAAGEMAGLPGAAAVREFTEGPLRGIMGTPNEEIGNLLEHGARARGRGAGQQGDGDDDERRRGRQRRRGRGHRAGVVHPGGCQAPGGGGWSPRRPGRVGDRPGSAARSVRRRTSTAGDTRRSWRARRQDVRGALGQEAGRLKSQAGNAARVAARGPEAEAQLIQGLTEQGAKKGVKAGRRLARYEKAQRNVSQLDAAIADAPEWYKREVDKLYRDVQNSPARTRPPVMVARQLSRDLAGWLRELDAVEGMNPALKADVEGAIRASIRDVRDIFNNFVQGPDGELTRQPLFDPEYIPGGQPLDAEGKIPPFMTGPVKEKRPTRTTLATEQRRKKTPLMPRNAERAQVVVRRHRASGHQSGRAHGRRATDGARGAGARWAQGRDRGADRAAQQCGDRGADSGPHRRHARRAAGGPGGREAGGDCGGDVTAGLLAVEPGLDARPGEAERRRPADPLASRHHPSPDRRLLRQGRTPRTVHAEVVRQADDVLEGRGARAAPGVARQQHPLEQPHGDGRRG